MTPKDIHVLIPRTCVSATLHGKRNFANVFKCMKLGWRGYLDAVNVITRVLMTVRQKVRVTERKRDLKILNL